MIARVGRLTAFTGNVLVGFLRPNLRLRRVVPILHAVGVGSLPVMIVTGAFIGMVLAVNTYAQFHPYGFDAALGTIAIGGIIAELGPVLAATMLAGRVGGSMAAELAVMRLNEQVDALRCLGVDPVRHLASPRVLACVCMIPLLTVVADIAGICGNTLLCVHVYGVDSSHYWEHTLRFVGPWDVFTGLIKSVAFGLGIGLVCCERGLRSQGGSEGVGSAATEAFVVSFIVILVLDLFLGMALHELRPYFGKMPPSIGF